MPKGRVNLISGIILIFTGICFNPWTLPLFFGLDFITSYGKIVFVLLIDVVLIVSGIYLIKKRKEIKISLKEKIIFVGSVVFALIVAEVVFRLFYPYISPADHLFGKPEIYEPKPYVMYGGKPNEGGFNSIGYIGVVPDLQKDSSEYRIIILGGSCVFNGDPTFTECLQDFFHSNNMTNVKCYNFGIPASVSGQEVARLVFDVADYNPDLVIMYNGANDFTTPLWADPRPGYPYNFFLYESNPLVEKDVSEYPGFYLGLYESKILRFLVPDLFIQKLTKFNMIRKNSEYLSQEWKDKISSQYLTNLLKAKKISDGFGAEFLCVFQPSIYTKLNLTDSENAILQMADRMDFFKELYTGMKEKLQNESTYSVIEFSDFSTIFDSSADSSFTDEFHTYQFCKPIIAKHLYDTINERFFQKDRSRYDQLSS